MSEVTATVTQTKAELLKMLEGLNFRDSSTCYLSIVSKLSALEGRDTDEGKALAVLVNALLMVGDLRLAENKAEWLGELMAQQQGDYRQLTRACRDAGPLKPLCD